MKAYKQDHFEFNTLPEGGIELVSVKDKSVTEAVIPTGVVRIGEGAFRDCAQLASLYIPASVVFIGSHAFDGCAALYDVRYEGDNSSWEQIKIGRHNAPLSSATVVCEEIVLSKDGSERIRNPLSKILASVLKFLRSKLFLQKILPAALGLALVIGVSLFFLTERPYNKYKDEGFYCTAKGFTVTLEKYRGNSASVVIPDGIDVIGNNAFYEDPRLASVTIPDGVTGISEYAFRNCTALTSIIIPDSVKSIGSYAFSNCSSLTSITIPNSVTSIGYDAFRGCKSLTSITIPDSVTSISNDAFSGCSSLVSITVDPDNTAYTSIDSNLYSKDGKTLIQYAVGKTDTEFTIPDSVTSIGGYAFYYCSSLASITIPDGVTSIGVRAFSNCTSLASITIPDSVTSIGNCAFYYCSSLVSITIPDGLTSIGIEAFSGCYSLTDIYYTGTEAQWNSIDKFNTNIPSSATVHYNYSEE